MTQAVDAAPGEAGATQVAKVASPQLPEAVQCLNDLMEPLGEQAHSALARLVVAVAEAAEVGVTPLLIAEALAGGDEVAAGRMFDLRAGEDFPEGGTYDNVMDEVLRTVRPKVREVAIWSAVSHLTDEDRAYLLRWWSTRSPEKLAAHGLVVTDLSAGVAPAELAAALEATELDMDQAACLVRRLGNNRKRGLAERGLVVFEVPNADQDTVLPTFVPGVRLWYADLDDDEKRQLIEFVTDPADGLIAQVSEVMEAAVAAGVVSRPSAAPSTATA